MIKLGVERWLIPDSIPSTSMSARLCHPPSQSYGAARGFDVASEQKQR
jgi:hypothetical protein